MNFLLSLFVSPGAAVSDSPLWKVSSAVIVASRWASLPGPVGLLRVVVADQRGPLVAERPDEVVDEAVRPHLQLAGRGLPSSGISSWSA